MKKQKTNMNGQNKLYFKKFEVAKISNITKIIGGATSGSSGNVQDDPPR